MCNYLTIFLSSFLLLHFYSPPFFFLYLSLLNWPFFGFLWTFHPFVIPISFISFIFRLNYSTFATYFIRCTFPFFSYFIRLNSSCFLISSLAPFVHILVFSISELTSIRDGKEKHKGKQWKRKEKKKRLSNWLSHSKDSYLILKKKKQIENFSPIILINIYNTKKILYRKKYI